MTYYRYNPPPGWAKQPEGWTPPAGWQPDPSWPPVPAGWQLWVEPPSYGPPGYPQRMVTKTDVQTSHTFHLIMSLLTCGLWAVFVWIPMVVWHAIGPKKKSVTRAT